MHLSIVGYLKTTILSKVIYISHKIHSAFYKQHYSSKIMTLDNAVSKRIIIIFFFPSLTHF